jgi:nucleoside-diphosphate-sugar epimerase
MSAQRVVFVTGGAGVLGRALCRELRAAGWRVRALVHRREVPEADERVDGSLDDEEALRRGTEGALAVAHLAARTHARRDGEYARVNLEGTRRVVAAAERAGARRLLFVSSRTASEKGGGYSRSKLAAERVVREAAVAHTIVRLPEVYGAGSAEGMDRIIALARAGRPIPIVGGVAEVCPAHVDDVVGPLRRALEADGAAGKTYTLAGECMGLREFADACRVAFASRSAIVSLPVPLVRAAATASRVLPLPLYPDQVDRLLAPKPPPSPEAAGELGFAPRPLAEGLAALE